MNRILYRNGYKYQLARDYILGIDLTGQTGLVASFIKLTPDGDLMIYKGYAWDGPSGPAIDTPNFMRGSLVHDVLYQLMREGQLPPRYRQYADDLLRQHCREDGMSWLRAWWVYRALRMFGGAAIKASSKKPIIQAPD